VLRGSCSELARRRLSFSPQALFAPSPHFSRSNVATVKSSEQTGNLKEALSRYIAYQEEIDRVRRKSSRP